jgi:hypothetical protein
MASFSGRIYRLAQAYLDVARNRLAEIDPEAEEELRQSLPRENQDFPGLNGAGFGASTPPNAVSAMERARAKIAAAQQEAAALREQHPERYNFSATPQTATPDGLPQVGYTPPRQERSETDVVATAYRMIGVAEGSPYPVVEKAVAKLRERCAPSRFPESSPERAEATQILRRVDDAFRILKNALGVPESRFDRLEL